MTFVVIYIATEVARIRQSLIAAGGFRFYIGNLIFAKGDGTIHFERYVRSAHFAKIDFKGCDDLNIWHSPYSFYSYKLYLQKRTLVNRKSLIVIDLQIAKKKPQ